MLHSPFGRRLALTSLALALTLVAALPVRAQQRAPRGYEEGAFELLADGLPALPVVVLVSPRGKFLLPAAVVLSQLAVPFTGAVDSTRLRVTRPAGIGFATLQWGTGERSVRVDTLTRLDTDDVLIAGGQLFVAAPRLGELVDGKLDVDLSTLSVRASRDGGFPAQVRLGVHERRREELRRSASSGVQPHADVPFVPRTGFGVVEWAVGGLLSPLSAPTAVETRVGMDLVGGMLDLHGAFGLPTAGAGASATGGELSYRRIFPARSWLRQLQLGDVISEGPLARSIRGVTISNAPYVRSLQFGDMAFSRPLPPGWEYEVFEGDRLVGYADAGSTGPLAVPLQYGTTPLRVRLYGPAGEVVESAVSYVIPIEQLRGGEWQYAAGAGRCALGQCTGMGYGELRYGVSGVVTLEGGADQLRDTLGTTVRPYGAVSYLPAPGWVASLQARRAAYVRAAVQNLGEGALKGGFTAGLNQPGEGGIAVAHDSDAVWFAQSALQLSSVLPRLGNRFLGVSSRVEGRQHGGGRRWDVTATAPMRNGLLDVGIGSAPAAAIAGGDAGLPLLRIAPTVSLTRGRFASLGTPLIRLDGGWQGTRLTQWEGALSVQPGRAFVTASIRKLAGVPGHQLVLGGSMTFGAGRALTRISRLNGRAEGGYSANGAVAFGGARRLTPLEYGGLGLSGLQGRVYRDRDGDGQFGPGDEPVAKVTVQVGGMRTVTDSNGVYSVWSALPYEALEVQLDSLSLEDPTWVPVLAIHALRPSPQQFTRIDFPLVLTREVIGILAAVPPLATPGGVAVELRDPSSGALYATRTFSDGAFYLSRVRPGRYLLTVSAPSLRALGAAAPEPRAVVVSADGAAVVEIPPLSLAPAH